MATTPGTASYPIGVSEMEPVDTSTVSGVSWGAIFAGAAAAAALSLILLVLGSGLGFAAMSPWQMSASRAATIGISAAVWLALTQIFASALGGYLAGRLRVKWARVHSDEVYFRDTAHGLLTWAVATLATAALMTSAITGVLGTAAQAGADAVKGVAGIAAAGAGVGAQAAGNNGSSAPTVYAVDSLFRTDPAAPAPGGDDAALRTEVGRIFANGLTSGSLSPDDRRYVATVIARRSGVAVPDAERRVDEAYGRITKAVADAEAAAKQAADTARKAAQHAALWMFVALLCGAFFASLAAMIGGRRRDGI